MTGHSKIGVLCEYYATFKCVFHRRQLKPTADRPDVFNWNRWRKVGVKDTVRVSLLVYGDTVHCLVSVIVGVP